MILKEIEDFSSHDYSRILKRNSWLSNYWIMGFISFGKYLLRNQNWSVLRNIQTIDFSWKRIEETIHEVYTLAAKYKNITVTEIQKK
jgi:TatD DNase family protein